MPVLVAAVRAILVAAVGSLLLAVFCVQRVAPGCGASRLVAGVAAGFRGCAFSWSLEEGCVLIQPCLGGEGCAFD